MIGQRVSSRKSFLLASIIGLQALMVLVIACCNYLAVRGVISASLRTITFLSSVAGVFLGMVAIYLIKEILRLVQKEQDLKVSKAMLAKNHDLIKVLSNQRHDFQNHLQVILGLIQMEREDSAEAYIKEVTNTLNDEASTTGRIKNLEVAALFITKKNQAEERDIPFKLDLVSDLNGLTIPATDIFSILGNLIDNAFDAVEGLEKGSHGEVKIGFYEGEKHFKITVLNRQPIIPTEHQKKIFQKGFTTKGMRGSGLGLAIVKELTEKNGGSIILRSDKETGTLFTLTFPKKV